MPDLPAPHGPVPSPRQRAWHRHEAYGFIHFSMNTFTGREWGFGDEDPARFDPAALDCAQWVAAAKAGGLTGLILTAKHHDGFCLWPSATTRHSVAASPFRGGRSDVVAELAAACRAGGLAFGVYCSPWDRNHAEYGQAGYVTAYHRQLHELLTGYGPLFEVWFDGANGGDGHYGGAGGRRCIDPRSYYRFDDLWADCHRLQPEAVLFSDGGPDVRWVGNERGVAGFTNWAAVPAQGFAPGLVERPDLLGSGDPEGPVWRPSECDVSIRPGWFWHEDQAPKDAGTLFDLWLASVGRGSALLLNLAPDRRGLIPDQDVAELAGFRRLVERFTGRELSRGARVRPEAPGQGDPDALCDPRAAGWWAAPERTAGLVVELPAEGLLGGIRLEEELACGQRVVAFAVDLFYHQGWTELARATTIGPRRILPLPPVPAERLRIRILAARAAPVLRRIAVYGR